MARTIPDDTLQAIRERVSVVEVISGYVSLKKTGQNHVGLCPFHSEKTPSFTVNEARGFFHCFGCGVGGNVFSFLIQADRISFPEAAEILARRAGISLPRYESRNQKKWEGERQALFDLNAVAQEYFRAAFDASVGGPARAYLAQREVSVECIEQYGLGFCPRGYGRLEQGLVARKLSLQAALDLGLLGRCKDGSFYERLWGRVTFPIRDGSGNIIGFGGRTIDDQVPKYLNSPDSVLFHKGNVLYGIYEARQAVRAADCVVIVEGYLDALALVEVGIPYVVANLGTAITSMQLHFARRFAAKVIVCFDGDTAGQRAAARAFRVCAEASIWGLGVFLPEGSDPDTFVRMHGKVAMQQLIEQATPLADFYIRYMNPGSEAPLPERAEAARQVGETLRHLQDPLQFNLLIRQAAQQFGVTEDALRSLRSSSPTHLRCASRKDPTIVAQGVALPKVEVSLVEVVARSAEAAMVLEEHRHLLSAFHNSDLATTATQLLDAWRDGRDVAMMLDAFPPDIAPYISATLLRVEPESAASALHVAQDCVTRLEERLQQMQRRVVRDRLRQAESSADEGEYRAQLERANELLRRRIR